MTYFGPKGAAIIGVPVLVRRGSWNDQRSSSGGLFSSLAGSLGRLAGGGIGKKFLLGSRVFLDRHRSIGGVVGHHLVHHNHGEHQHQQTGGSDGKGQRPHRTNRLAATGTVGRLRGNRGGTGGSGRLSYPP